MGNRTVTSLLSRSPTIQRILTIDGVEKNAEDVRQNTAHTGLTSGGLSVLVAMTTNKKVTTRYESWPAAVQAVDGLNLSPAKKRAKQAYSRMAMEANSILLAGDTDSLGGDFKNTIAPMLEELKGLQAQDPLQAHEIDDVVERIQAVLRPARKKLFSMSSDRSNQVADTKMSATPNFGYHLTKLANIPGIRASGLDPNMGATDRGSVAMSTADQVKGSIQTSERRVVFGTKPSTFRPYVNQYEDRRQMIQGTPTALKPIMLRFHVDSVVGWANVTQDDYMDTDAHSARVVIPPEAIQALTGAGDWVPITDLDLDGAPLQMRDKADDARMGVKWEGSGVPVILSLDEVKKAFDSVLFDTIESEFGTKGSSAAVQALEAQRDKVVGTRTGSSLTLSYTFRGATMQTSGNPKTWEYAFNVATKPDQALPDWLIPAMLHYKNKYGDVAARQISEFDQARNQ